ncbi:TonB-dependent receptor family protein [Hymenobacter sp. 15J16-1T3B]|uniref:outer membrane beta-barrel family protein n=1 Tax=Hymenobacter sp. 15J16-1T3B TaxID=2886941 RepID=UPI001D12BF66|nr:outer membrane beta-barrel family protein [Hymenobacter sp. 15J16-1T3B]MCC3158425.1 TonB-dependent receptor family protein [Hymenobacter sp. 15J16-1T3B]
MNLRFCLLPLLLCCRTALAQQPITLTGTVLDPQHAALPFANVSVEQATDSAFVTGMATDMNGVFRLPVPAPGTYRIKINALGYRAWTSPVLTADQAQVVRTLGNITLQTSPQLLQGVTVRAQKPLLEQHPDRLVVNVDGSALTAGNTAFDVLSKAPGVFVDQDGNIQLNGKSGVQILLDGKRVYLSRRELQTLLQNLPAAQLRTLELMSNPSARFDAEGAAGVINLTLKKNAALGLSGSTYAGTHYNGAAGYSAGSTVNLKQGPWSSFGSLDLARRPTRQSTRMQRTFGSASADLALEQQGEQTGFRTAPTLRLGTDYDFTARHSVGATAHLVLADEATDFASETRLGTGITAGPQRVLARNRQANRLRSGTVDLHYLGQLDTLGTTLAAEVDYATLRDLTHSDYQNRYVDLPAGAAEPVQRFSSHNPVRYGIFAVKTDYTRPLGAKTKLELGAKHSQVRSDNDLAFYQETGLEAARLDVTRSNRFLYQEAIYAGYANLATSLGERWQLQAGLRAEQTRSRGTSPTLHQITSRRYLNLFPSVFVQQRVSKDYQIGYQYSRRITRPQYEHLNPFVFFVDPYTVAQGNPQLRPQYTNAWQLSQTLKSTYNLTLGYARTADYMAEVPTQRLVDTLTVLQQRNVRRFDQLSGTLVAPLRLAARWQVSNVLSVSYQNFRTELQGQSVRNTRLHYFLQSTHRVELPAGLRLEVSGVYLGPQAYGIYQVQRLWWVDAGLKRSFLDDKLDVSLNVADMFRSRHLRGAFQAEANRTAFDVYRGTQSVGLQVRYSFRRGATFNAKPRNTSLEELNRASE